MGPALSGDVAEPTVDVEEPTCTTKTADELVTEWRESLLTEAKEPPAIPACPRERNTCAGGSTSCEGQNPCQAAGPTTPADTGLNVCQRTDGTLFKCKGKTIHVKSMACSQCPCCSGPPPYCLCPNDCGEISVLTCN